MDFDEELDSQIRLMWGNLGQFIKIYKVTKLSDLRWHDKLAYGGKTLQQIWLVEAHFDSPVWIGGWVEYDQRPGWFDVPLE